MKKPPLYPLTFGPIYKHYLWGGKNLPRFGKSIPADKTVAESWEIADHDQDVSIVKNGPLAGRSLRELVDLYGRDLCPESKNGRFPIIVKFLDADRRLSVQVHPDDEYARTHEGPTEMGKNECWFILDALPEAELIFGIKKGITREKLRKLIGEGRIEEGLNRLPIKPGDFLFIETGTVHALLENTVVCEILQNSDTTYRLYDWGRTGADGKPRPLHIDKAMEVIHFPSGSEYERHLRRLVVPADRADGGHTKRLLRNEFFNIDHLRHGSDFRLDFSDEHFHVLVVLAGGGELRCEKMSVSLEIGKTVLIPRPVRSYRVVTSGISALMVFL
jgi:mannose-6-phosphate isomerase